MLEAPGAPPLSNEDVNWRTRLRRVLGMLAFIVLAAAAVLAAIVPIQQRRLRIRAEAILADLHQIELRKTNWSEAKERMERWKEWGDYIEECGETLCRHSVELYDGFGSALWGHLGVAQYFIWLNGPYEFLGGRVVRLTARLDVADGIVWGKGIVAYIHVSQLDDADGLFGGHGYDLIAEAGSQSRLNELGGSPQIVLHPDYVIGTPGGCTSCLMVYARFTPYAEPATVRRLMDVNLSCIDRWHPCRYKPDIMPRAWEEFTKRRPNEPDTWKLLQACEFPIEVVGRDADHVAVVEVVSNRREGSPHEYQVSTVRLRERLKAASFWELHEVKDVRVFDDAPNRTPRMHPTDISVGGSFIFAFRRNWGGASGPDVWLYSCGAIPLTKENLAAVNGGIELDFAAKYRAEPEPPRTD
jgi:hypothetical protein